MLPDGTYEAIVVDADETSVADSAVLSLAITAGAAKGEVIDVVSNRLHDPLDLLAMPCILVVADGEPSVVFD